MEGSRLLCSPNNSGSIDLVDHRIESARKRMLNRGIEFIKMNCTDLEFEDNYFDCATACVMLHDMPFNVRRKAVSELARVTKDRIVIFEPRTFTNAVTAYIYGTVGEILDESQNFRSYARDNMNAIFEENNLDVIVDQNVWWNIMNVKVGAHKNI